MNRVICIEGREDVSVDPACNILSPRQVLVNFGNGLTRCIVDSGADVSVLKPDMVPAKLLIDSEGGANISLEAAFGPQRSARLLNVEACLAGDIDGRSKTAGVMLTCAITEELNGSQGLITVSDYEALKQQSSVFLPTVRLLAGTSMLYRDPTGGRDRMEEKLPRSTDGGKVEVTVELPKIQVVEDELVINWNAVNTEQSDFILRPDDRLMYSLASVDGGER
ncbi:MAG: hypothetical protein MN733_30645, partial [Nitrososphaera sp.]|nr:hypothetical protein [Nitrososphaera sp.]